MIYVQYDKENTINLIHYVPFDVVNGLGKTREELLLTGALVEKFEEYNYEDESKLPIYKYNPEGNTVYYELIDKPMTLEEEIRKALVDLAEENRQLRETLNEVALSLNEIRLINTK